MSGDDFFRTQMGHRFYEATMPKIASQLERLNANLEALLAELQKKAAAPSSTRTQPTPSQKR